MDTNVYLVGECIASLGLENWLNHIAHPRLSSSGHFEKKEAQSGPDLL
jgi:hypothetical protein